MGSKQARKGMKSSGMLRKEKIKDFKCESCGKNFGLKRRLNRHVKIVHQKKVDMNEMNNMSNVLTLHRTGNCQKFLHLYEVPKF